MSAGNIKRDKLKLVKKQKESGDVPEEINEQEVRERESHHCIVVAVAIVCVRLVYSVYGVCVCMCVCMCVSYFASYSSLSHTLVIFHLPHFIPLSPSLSSSDHFSLPPPTVPPPPPPPN